MAVLTASDLAPLVNGFTIGAGPPKTIVVANASQLAELQDITVTGKLLKKQIVRLDVQTNRRTARLAAGGGRLNIEADGDLHFNLGTRQLRPHIGCELQNAASSISNFRDAVGSQITVAGFFRCLFEHPGFHTNDDAHIFEIHPVRAVNLDGSLQAFEIDPPDPNSIHTWTSPHPLNDQDSRIQVSFDADLDTLTFSGMSGQDENYVRVSGGVSEVDLQSGGAAPATFTLTSDEIGHPIQVLCLQGTSAILQLRALTQTSITMVGLRNIDLGPALQGQYVINLLGIDIQAA